MIWSLLGALCRAIKMLLIQLPTWSRRRQPDYWTVGVLEWNDHIDWTVLYTLQYISYGITLPCFGFDSYCWTGCASTTSLVGEPYGPNPLNEMIAARFFFTNFATALVRSGESKGFKWRSGPVAWAAQPLAFRKLTYGRSLCRTLGILQMRPLKAESYHMQTTKVVLQCWLFAWSIWMNWRASVWKGLEVGKCGKKT